MKYIIIPIVRFLIGCLILLCNFIESIATFIILILIFLWTFSIKDIKTFYKKYIFKPYFYKLYNITSFYDDFIYYKTFKDFILNNSERYTDTHIDI